MIKAATIFAAMWLLSCCFTVAWSKWGVLSSIDQQYQHAYSAVAPSKIYSGGINDDAVRFMLNKITLELDKLAVKSPISVLRNCRITNIGAQPEVPYYSRLLKRLQFELVLDDPHHHLSYSGSADCYINWFNLLGSQFLFCSLLALGLFFLPRPLSRHDTNLIAHYQALNWSHEHINRLRRYSPQQQQWVQSIVNHPQLATMPVEAVLSGVAASPPGPVCTISLNWLRLAYAHTPDPKQAFEVAFDYTDSLVFDVQQRIVVVHGIPLKLTPTPYFYYLWYALKRQNTGSGWVLNPLTTKADYLLAEQLIALMEQHGGHAKAINDLRRNGLTAKKLDQNRNKIKDEVTAVLGEELAVNYLFDARREATSMRYEYRISLSGNKIKVT